MMPALAMLLIQVSPGDLRREMERLQRNYEFLSYGLTAAWIILVFYVLIMVSRQRKLKREIARLRELLETREPQNRA